MKKKTKLTPNLKVLLTELSAEELKTGIIQSNPNPPVGLLEVANQNPRHQLEDAILETDLRHALTRARKNSGASIREVAANEGISVARAHEIEHANLKLELQTLVRHANALGYEVSLTLTPHDARFERIETML
jgi:ribosome-binding protein aMBF1 (putative translation factor)